MNDEALIQALRTECLKDTMDPIANMRAALLTLQEKPRESLLAILKDCHGLKGNMQASAFNHCGDFIHGVESILGGFEERLRGSSGTLKSDDVQILEFLLSDVILAMESYFAELSRGAQDSESLIAKRKVQLQLLSAWETPPAESPGNSGGTPVQPVCTEFEPVAARRENLQSEPDVNFTGQQRSPLLQNLSSSAKVAEGLFLLCRAFNRDLAINIEGVVEVIQARVLTPLPYAHGNVAGLINLRGEVLAIVDLARTLTVRESEKKTVHADERPAHRSYIVVCAAAGKRFGFLVDEAQQVTWLEAASLQTLDSLSGTQSADKINTVSVQGEQMILLIDPIEIAS